MSTRDWRQWRPSDLHQTVFHPSVLQQRKWFTDLSSRTGSYLITKEEGKLFTCRQDLSDWFSTTIAFGKASVSFSHLYNCHYKRGI
ncbi:unnamed protein product [Sphagnum troendelagicum]|uniref:Uncharacterized protein n=1 Tax=Sphagnum troendelagicum TaxID=128251 RepID=A0ABP0THH5_9BRYO